MTPEQLKKSILFAAFSGKLVNPSKDELVCDKQFKKVEECPEQYIPETWRWVYLTDVATILYGFPFNSDLFNENRQGKALIRIRDIIGGKTSTYTTEECTENYNITKGDMLVGMDGNFQVEFWNSEDAWLNQRVCKISANSKYLNQKYLYYYLPIILKNINDSVSYSTVKHLSAKILNNIILPLPSVHEQYRIVAKIEELFPYLERYAEAYEKIEQFNANFPENMKKSILQYAIQGKLVEQRPEEGTAEELYQQIQEEKQKLIKEGKIKKEKPLAEITEDEIPFEIPESWKWIRLGKIIIFQGGYAFKSTEYVQSSKNQVIRLGNVKNNTLLIHEKAVFVDDEVAQSASDYRLRENDILVTMTGTRRKKDYFFTLVVKKEDLQERNLYLNQRVGCFRTMPGIDVEYLLAVLQNEVIKNIIFLKETGTANQGNLGSEDMKEYVYIPLPPLEEQRRIVGKLKELLPYCDSLISK